MATLVGTQDDFVDAMYALCELDYDAVKAYQTAINRLESQRYQDKLSEFKADHERHIQEISALLQKHNVEAPTGPSVKHLLAKGNVYMADLLGDDSILKAMLSNEEDTNSAYERLNSRADEWEDAKEMLRRGLEDEQRHKSWIEGVLEEKSRQDKARKAA